MSVFFTRKLLVFRRNILGSVGPLAVRAERTDGSSGVWSSAPAPSLAKVFPSLGQPKGTHQVPRSLPHANSHDTHHMYQFCMWDSRLHFTLTNILLAGHLENVAAEGHGGSKLCSQWLEHLSCPEQSGLAILAPLLLGVQRYVMMVPRSPLVQRCLEASSLRLCSNHC